MIRQGEIIPLRPKPGQVGRLGSLETVVPRRADHPLPANDSGVSLGNIVAFVRPRGNARTAPAVPLPADVAQVTQPRSVRERGWFGAFVMLSIVAHAGLFVAVWGEPTPLASIGLEVMSVE